MKIENSNKTYKSDKNLVYSCQYHVIFCPKYRRPVLTEKIAQKLKETLPAKARELNGEILEMEVMPDHVHLLVSINPKLGIYSFIAKLKGYSAFLLRSEFKELKTKLPCMWSGSKFISSVGEVSLDTVKQYIENQKGK
jgi:putative transposase